MLHIIDDCWKKNLRQLDELRHSVQNASYEQKDPLLIFKLESVKLFDEMVNDMNNRISNIPSCVDRFLRCSKKFKRLHQRNTASVIMSRRITLTILHNRLQHIKIQERRPNSPSTYRLFKRQDATLNDPCPCGSGKKFKIAMAKV